jgi:hypothetical protein
VRKADAELRDRSTPTSPSSGKHPGWSRLLVKYFGDDAPLVLGRQKLD